MSSSRRQYPFHLIEPKWQQFWDEQQTFRAFNPGEVLPDGHPFARRHQLSGKVAAAQLPPKFYILDMFPYPSGAGLHVGHPEGYTATDILARYKRAQGLHVLHPMGWDAFGLPAEQYAIKTGQHPRQTTEANVANFTKQIKSLGFSYDWSRELATTDPDYFKWTQWIFLKLYNSWFNLETNKAEPIETLKYPAELLSPPQPDDTSDEWERYAVLEGEREIKRRAYRDSKRLAYVSAALVWWCEELGTVLANEEVVDGKSEVGGFPVVRKPMRQWMLRITAYAERLLADLDTIDWSDSLKDMQRNWIGRSEGAEVEFKIKGSEKKIRVFTTRPDTLFGATYMAVAPDNKEFDDLIPNKWPAGTPDKWKFALKDPKVPPALDIRDYRDFVASLSDMQRQMGKTGVFSGIYAINPVNKKEIPIFFSEYILASYGTGAIMAVPAHDERDFEFARRYDLPIVPVARPEYGDNFMLELKCDGGVPLPDEKLEQRFIEHPELFYGTVLPFVMAGIAINSKNEKLSLNDLPTAEAKKKITAWLEAEDIGKKTVNFKLRDWLFSRQRYWGEPFPIVWKLGTFKDSTGSTSHLYHEALPEEDLPVLPPELTDYKPTPDGRPPLARAEDWAENVPGIPGATRETNTMPQWAGSCWYYLRYLDAKNSNAFVSKEAESYWMGSGEGGKRKVESGKLETTPGVDLYVGGTEHAVLHLLYARFWHKVLFDLGQVSTPEPFFKLVNQGLILGELEYHGFQNNKREWVSDREVTDIAEASQPLVGKDRITGEVVVGVRVSEKDVVKEGPWFFLKQDHPKIRLATRCFKMSKSRGNVVNPDDVLGEFGADSLRLYEMFMGPLEMVKPWNTKGVEGVYRFLGRVWRLFVDEASETEFEQAETLTTRTEKCEELLELIKLNAAIKDMSPTPAQLKTLHACIKKVTEDLDGLRFNTAISAMMVFVNDAITWETKPVSVLREFMILLAPFAPHIAEELWEKLNIQHSTSNTQHPISLSYAPWPKFDPALLVEDTLEIPVQVNGKLRDVIKVPANADNAAIEAAAKVSEKARPFLAGKTIKKVIIVPKKMVNLIVA